MSEWKKGVIGELAKGYRGVSYAAGQLCEFKGPETVTLLRSNNIDDAMLNFDDVQIVPARLVSDEQLLELGDIAVCMSNGSKELVGKAAPILKISGERLTIGAFCSVFRPAETANTRFVSFVFQSLEYKKNLQLALSGTAISNLRNVDIESFSCDIPPVMEQLRIARILDTLDTTIRQTEAMIAKLRQVKQGLLHDLLTRGIDVNGELRPSVEKAPQLYKPSPLGWIPKEWEICQLDQCNIDLIDGDRGVNYPSESELSNEGSCLFLSAKNVTKIGFRFAENQFISQRKDDLLGTGKLSLDDIVVTTRGTVGNFAHFDGSVTFENMRINSGMLILRNTDRRIDTSFFYHSFKDYYFRIEYEKKGSGSAQPQLPARDLKTFHLTIPSKFEQAKIVSRLSDFDTWFNREADTLAKLKQTKSGLLDDLLTGRVRVTPLLSKGGSLS